LHFDEIDLKSFKFFKVLSICFIKLIYLFVQAILDQ